ncbi:uncharacterized protein [Gossypium hirsutum]|uniref:Reverse transcriptase Ty1/copia-type domain-containing protein n=1 Tax=Gossypium hirsutum TaxID=3635 RepID=A0A1U8NG51_GOSHI|nr:uncharacterized protein LOC107948012 [Gossypium hirsutum]
MGYNLNVIAMVVQKGWNIYQLDVKSTFLHEELVEKVFVDQPRGFEKERREHKVFKLKKAIQRKYVNEVLERFGMLRCNSVRRPIVPGTKLVKNEDGVKVDVIGYKQIVGSL